MKKQKARLCTLIALMLICASCAPQTQTRDAWAYAEPDGTWTEANRKQYLEVLYMYESLRPDAVPEASTDAPLLRLTDERYRNLDKEAYMPRADELQYEEMKPIALSLVEAYHIADKAPDLCVSHFRPSYLSSGTRQWITGIIYEDGYHYNLYIDASDGSFQSWIRRPQGYWTTLQYDASAQAAKEPLTQRTDEELQNAAKAYIEAAPAFDASQILELTTVTDATLPYVRAGIRPDQVYHIVIDHDDLSVTAVMRML